VPEPAGDPRPAPRPRPPAGLLLLGAAAAAVVAAAASVGGNGWLSDDHLLLARAGGDAGLLLEARHLSLPRRALWAAAAAGAPPWTFRAVALVAHLLSGLVLVPALAAGLAPAWGPRARRAAGLLFLALPVSLAPLVWPATLAYPLLVPLLLAAAVAHLRWVEGGDRRWRAAALGACATALLTWEQGVAGPPLLALASWSRGRSPRRALADALPALALLLPYVGLKLALGSTEALAPRGPLRALANAAAVPLLQLAPVPLPRAVLLSAAGPALGLAAAAALLGAAWRLGRLGAALLLMGALVLGPVLPGPGPAPRYLYLSAPFAALLVVGAARTTPPRPAARTALLAALGLWAALAAGTAWGAAAAWRRADAEAGAVLAAIERAAGAHDARTVAVLDAPDRLPGWGPTWRFPVWRHGLEQALAARGLALAGRAHVPPLDVERQGLVPSAPPLDPARVAAWRASGALVLRVEPDGEVAPYR